MLMLNRSERFILKLTCLGSGTNLHARLTPSDPHDTVKSEFCPRTPRDNPLRTVSGIGTMISSCIGRFARQKYRDVLVSVVSNDRKEDESRGNIRVLDVGSGNCWLLSLLPTEYTRIGIDMFTNVHGIDDAFVDPLAGRSIQFVLGDGRRLPFRDGIFDVVYSNEFTSHVSNIDDALMEQMRILRRGGLIVIMDANILNPKTFFYLFVVRYVRSRSSGTRFGGMKWLLRRDRPLFEEAAQDKRWEGWRDENIHSHYWWRKKLRPYSSCADFRVTTFWSYFPFSCFGAIANKVLVTGKRL